MHSADYSSQFPSLWKIALGLYLSLGIAPGIANGVELLSIDMRHDEAGTRVVLEFDARAGYRLERTQSTNGSGNLWVTLAARATPLPLPAADGFVDKIQLVQTENSPAVIQLALTEPGLRVQDHVLVSPPRLVFEVRRRGDTSQIAWQRIIGRERKSTPLFASVRDPRPEEPPIAALRDVRIGSHPEFSRVVFEMDHVTAYHIDSVSEQGEIVVTLSASATTHELVSPSEFIGSVHVEPRSRGSVARVRLKKTAVRLSEITLANPNRIVIDIAHAI